MYFSFSQSKLAMLWYGSHLLFIAYEFLTCPVSALLGSQIMPTEPVCAVLENISRKEAIDILYII